MITELDDAFWDRLRERIEARSVIPVVGPGAITFGQNDDLLHPWLAQKIAEKFHLQLPDPPRSLQSVVDAYRNGADTYEDKRDRVISVHLKVFDFLRDSPVHPGITLYRLAAINDFQLFLTTSFDPLLARAVELARHAARPPEWVLATSLLDGFRELPATLGNLPYACVYHLLGKIRKPPDCALWDDETLAFLRELDQQLRSPGHLSNALHGSHFLFLGLSLDNWPMRFLVQTVKGKHLSALDHERLYISDIQQDAERDQVVVFFSRLTHQVYVIPISPREFIAELARHWRDSHPKTHDDITVMVEAHRLAHCAPGCIFISYASPDLPIAEYIVKQLQDKGILVWFDKQQLLPGREWEADLTEAVEQTCGLFLSLISNTSAQRLEAYDILERNLAAKRRDRFAENEVFYIPLRIDEGEPLVPANEPRCTKNIQAVCKPGGHLDDTFIEYLRRLQLNYIKRLGFSFTPPPTP